MRVWRCVTLFRRPRECDEQERYEAPKKGAERNDNLDALRRVANDKQRGNWYHKITHRDSVVAHLPKFPQCNVHFVRKLSEGRFGDVYVATAESILPGECTSQVTVKALRSDSCKEEQSDFLSEAWFRNSLKHHNIIRLLGVCMYSSPKLMILELMEEESNLLTYLRQKNPSETGSVWSDFEVTNIALDIAQGVEYLHSKKIMYRDLCASSCVVLPEKGVEMAASDTEVSSMPRKTVVKLAAPLLETNYFKFAMHFCDMLLCTDFSLTCDLERREYYRRQSAGQLLTRWMSPEALLDGVFTEHTDAWAYGVVLWEITSFGQLPYPDKSSSDLLDFIASGQRLNKPPHCSKKIYHLMASCWQLPDTSRPSFSALVESLRHMQQRSASSTALLSASGKKLKSLLTLPLASLSSTLSDDARSHNGVYAMSAPASPILRSESSSFQRSKNLSQRSARSLAMFSNDRFPTPLLSNRASGSLGEGWELVNVRGSTSSSTLLNGTTVTMRAAGCGGNQVQSKSVESLADQLAETRRYSCPLDVVFNNCGHSLQLSVPLAKSLPQIPIKIVHTLSAVTHKQLRETSL